MCEIFSKTRTCPSQAKNRASKRASKLGALVTIVILFDMLI